MMDSNRVLSKWLPKKIRACHIALANALYDHLQSRSWKTELTLAKELGTTTRQIRRAKAYLEYTGRVVVEIGQNGRRDNPIHTLIKTSPIKPIVVSGKGVGRLDWHVLEELSAKELNNMPLEALFDVYEDVGLHFFPLHYPKFKRDSTPYCSCRSGRNCPYVGKHPVCQFKELNYSMPHTYHSIRDYWFYEHWSKRDTRYNVGIRTDGFIVVDVDYRDGGQESLGLLEEELGELPAALTVRTGNGRHLYLKDTSGVVSGAIGRWKGIDIKTGGGSYVVAPLSVHKSGVEYAWETVGAPEELPEAWRYALTDGKPANGKAEKQRVGNHYGARRGIKLPNVLTPDYVIHNHYRNDTLFRFASRERGRGGDYQRVLARITEINGAHTQEPLKPKELEYIAASVCMYPTNAERRTGRTVQTAS